jgi:hypothetical protein
MPKLVTVHLADGNHDSRKFMPEDFEGITGLASGSRIYVKGHGLIDVIENQDEVERLVREARKETS